VNEELEESAASFGVRRYLDIPSLALLQVPLEAVAKKCEILTKFLATPSLPTIAIEVKLSINRERAVSVSMAR
jgi:hypothetical protein